MVKHRKKSKKFLPLNTIHRPRIPTDEAAYYLALQPQTLRWQFMRQSYDPRLAPIKIGNRIMWLVAGIKQVLKVLDDGAAGEAAPAMTRC